MLVKRPKPGQELRIDLPAIGPRTVDARAGGRPQPVSRCWRTASSRRSGSELVRRADAAQCSCSGLRPSPSGPRRLRRQPPRHCTELRTLTGAAPARIADATTWTKAAALLTTMGPSRHGRAVIIDRGHVLAVECGRGAGAASPGRRIAPMGDAGGAAPFGHGRAWRKADRSELGIVMPRRMRACGAGCRRPTSVQPAHADGRRHAHRLGGAAGLWRSGRLARMGSRPPVTDAPRAGRRRERAYRRAAAISALPRRWRAFRRCARGQADGRDQREAGKGRVRYLGVGGEAHGKRGARLAVSTFRGRGNGPARDPARLPRIIRACLRTVDAAIAAEPDAVVIIDSPEFTHPIAKRIRQRRRTIPIIDYVSPSVWAWRPGRARKMRPMSITCWRCCRSSRRRTSVSAVRRARYVGHPLIERLDWMHGLDPHALADRLEARGPRAPSSSCCPAAAPRKSRG